MLERWGSHTCLAGGDEEPTPRMAEKVGGPPRLDRVGRLGGYVVVGSAWVLSIEPVLAK
jgi:hypothetical protein